MQFKKLGKKLYPKSKCRIVHYAKWCGESTLYQVFDKDDQPISQKWDSGSEAWQEIVKKKIPELVV